jgi:adenine-specific DNA-methyltransferase
MRDRIELLWKLLKPDGLLAIQIDDNEYARLYLLLVEICGEAKLKTISIKMSEATGVKMASVYKTGSIPKLKEYIVLAKKDGIRGLKIEKIAKEKWDDEYKIYVDNVSQDEISQLKEIIENEERTNEEIIRADKICQKFIFKNILPVMNTLSVKDEDRDSWLIENSWRIVRTVATTDTARKRADEKRKTIKESIPAFIVETKQKKAYIIKNGYEQSSAQPRIKLLFADDYLRHCAKIT